MVAGVLGDGGEYVSSLLRKEVLLMANKEAEKILKDDLGVKSLRSFPKNINVHYYNDSEYILTMTLLSKAVGLGKDENLNMQNDAAAFEAWALIIKAQTSIDDSLKSLRISSSESFSILDSFTYTSIVSPPNLFFFFPLYIWF